MTWRSRAGKLTSMGLILGLISFFGWGTGDIFAIYASRKIGAYRTTAFAYFFGFIIASLYVPFALAEVGLIPTWLLFINFFAGSIYLGGGVLLNEGFRRSNPSLVGIIIQSSPAVVLVLSSLIFGDPVSTTQVFWIALIFLGVFVCTVDLKDLVKKKITKDKGIWYALIAAGIFSIYFTFFRVFADIYGWFWPNYISFSSFPLTLFLAKKIFTYKEQIGTIKSKPVLLAIVLSSLLLRSGDVALNVGIASGFSSITAPLAGASPILFVILSALVYKDPVTTQQKVGVGLTLLGITCLSFIG